MAQGPLPVKTLPVNLHLTRQYPLSATDLKGLRQAVPEDGIHAPCTRSILQSFNRNLLTPQEMYAYLLSPAPCWYNGRPYLEMNASYRIEKRRKERKKEEITNK